MKHTLALFAGLVLFSIASTVVAGNDDAQKLVVETTDRIMSKLKAEQDAIKQDPERVITLVDEIVLPHFDFTRMSQWAMGKYWRTASKEQQEKFIVEFRMLLVRTYSKALADNVDQKVNFLPLRGGKDDEITVRTEVAQQAGFPLPINYEMHLKDGEWKVFDVVIDGISLVANYRTSFAKTIKKDGIDKLIASLVDRNKNR